MTKNKTRDTHLRKKVYRTLVARDGERCKLCGKTPPDVYLEVDHIDGDKTNDADHNLQLLCKRDNNMKNPRGRGKGDIVKRRMITMEAYAEIMDSKAMSPEMAARKKFRAAYSHWLYNKVKAEGRITVNEAVFAGAKHVGCSSVTIRTSYLPEETSSAGMFQMFHDLGEGKNFVSFRNAAALGVDTDFEVLDPEND